jgi:hypothetical protein
MFQNRTGAKKYRKSNKLNTKSLKVIPNRLTLLKAKKVVKILVVQIQILKIVKMTR